MGCWAFQTRMAAGHQGSCMVSKRGREGMLGCGAQGVDGDCVSRVLCGELEGT